MVFNHVLQGIEVGVVGDIPLATAKKIAESITPANVDSAKVNDLNSKGEQ